MTCESFQPEQLNNGEWKADLSSFFTKNPNDVIVQFEPNSQFEFNNLNQNGMPSFQAMRMDMRKMSATEPSVIGGVSRQTVGVEDLDSMIVVVSPQDTIFKEFIPVYVRSTTQKNQMIKGIFIPEKSLDILSSERTNDGGISISLNDGTTIVISQEGSTHHLIDSFYGDQDFYKPTVTQ
jgi:hypothetical protein